MRRLGWWTVGFLMVLAVASVAMAAEPEAAKVLTPDVKKMMTLVAGFGIAIAAFGGAFAQSRAIVSALDGIARNPAASGRIVTPMIIGLAMIESLVIYALLVALLMVFKL